jgi:ABC-2 type transport system ATP-binding protein
LAAIIDARGVVKRYRQHKRFAGVTGALRTLITREFTEVSAVDDVSFAIEAGEAVGYLGPNGAGKSTTIKILTGILLPDGGTVSVLGRTPHKQRTQNAREIGVVFGQRSQLWWDLPTADSFELHRRIYGIAEPRFRENLKRIGETLGLMSFLEQPVRQLSLGQRMRAEFCMALLHDPKILFLDEPTIGLDVVAKDAIRKFLSKVNREDGVSIVLTTHDLQDIEEICPRLIMIDQGKLLYDGDVGGLKSAVGVARELTLEFADDPGPVALTVATLLADEGRTKRYALERDDVSIVDVLREIGVARGLKDIAIAEPRIEEVIRTFYQRQDG